MTYNDTKTSLIQESKIYQYFLSPPSSNSFFEYHCASTDFINLKFIQNAKDLNLTGKVVSSDLDSDFNSLFQRIQDNPPCLPITSSTQCEVDILFDSNFQEKKNSSTLSYLKSEKKKLDSAFREFPAIKYSSVLSFSSPSSIIPTQIIEKKSYSTKEDDSIPKIKTMILTPRKAINDFNNTYNKNTFSLKGIGMGIGCIPQIIPSLPSCIGNLQPLSHSHCRNNESQPSFCFLHQKKEREQIDHTPIKKNKNKKYFTAFNSSSSFKTKKIKKSKKSIVEFFKGVINKDNDQRYNYLYKEFKETIDSNYNYNYEETFLQYQYYITFGKSNEEKLRFGESPLNYYQNLIENIKSKGVTTKALRKLDQQMTQIQEVISHMPVFKVPINIGKHMSNCSKENEGRCKMLSLDFEAKPTELKYKCSVCNNAFTSAQGLGGHMSRKHKNQSENYKKKKATREKRAPLRIMNKKIKIALCEKYDLEYDTLISTKQGKRELRHFMNMRHNEYVSMKKEMKKDRNIL